MSTEIKVTLTTSDPEAIRMMKASVDKKKLINKYIREGKSLKELNEHGIRFRKPV